jgi:hypothetical protein
MGSSLSSLSAGAGSIDVARSRFRVAASSRNQKQGISVNREECGSHGGGVGSMSCWGKLPACESSSVMVAHVEHVFTPGTPIAIAVGPAQNIVYVYIRTQTSSFRW